MSSLAGTGNRVVYADANGLLSAPSGAWITPPYNAADFTGSGAGMTWTVQAGDVVTYAYTIIGKTMMLSIYLNTTSVGGTLNDGLGIRIPGGYTSAKKVRVPIDLYDNNVKNVGAFFEVGAGGTKIYAIRSDYSIFSASTNLTSVRGQIMFEIN